LPNTILSIVSQNPPILQIQGSGEETGRCDPPVQAQVQAQVDGTVSEDYMGDLSFTKMLMVTLLI